MHSLQTRLPQSRIELERGFGEGEFLIVYECLKTRLTNEGRVEDSSID